MRVVYRAIADQEFRAAADLFFDSLNDLVRRHNAEPARRTHDIVVGGYRHVAKTGIFRVAELDGRIVALACATLRDTQWFLSGFWAAPDLRLHGIGGPLLREVFDEGRRRGATSFYVWASIDEAALAAYMKLGMLPGTQLFTFTGEPRGLPAARPGQTTGEFTHREIAALERELVGVSREVDDAYWREHGFAGRAVRRGGDVLGFYYLIDGIVGPCGWASDDVAEDVLGQAIRDAAASHDTVSLSVPGMNHVGLRMALASGLRLIRQSHLLWTEPIGAMERYIPSGPLLF